MVLCRPKERKDMSSTPLSICWVIYFHHVIIFYLESLEGKLYYRKLHMLHACRPRRKFISRPCPHEEPLWFSDSDYSNGLLLQCLLPTRNHRYDAKYECKKKKKKKKSRACRCKHMSKCPVIDAKEKGRKGLLNFYFWNIHPGRV